jgi:PAS domain S-box-containing protein
MKKKPLEVLSRLSGDEYYKFIMNHLQESLLVIDKNYVIVDANEIIINKYGHGLNRVIGKHCYEITHGYDKPCSNYSVKCMLEEVFESKITKKILHRHVFEHKKVVWENILTTPLIKNDGHVEYVIETLRDVTELYETQENLKTTLKGIIHILTTAIEKRDPYTAGHQQRVTQLSIAIMRELGGTTESLATLTLASQIHDIGKIAVPAELLSKPTKLSNEEFALIKKHPETGREILNGFDFGMPIDDIIWQHHENIDGSGYPQGITGEEILLESKIIRVADTVEAMASHRPYRPGLGIEVALEEIEAKKGIYYDSNIVDICVMLFKEKGFSFE